MESQATTLRDAILYFSEFENCRKFMVQLRWPNGVVTCPRCGSDNVTWLAKARVWKCYAKHERPTFTLKTDTIFEDSPIQLEKWLTAAWMIIACKNGISSYELHRGLGVTQKSAWFMLHRIRLAMQETGFNKMSGAVEADETFIGGKARNMHAGKRAARIHGRGTIGKQIVFGLLERKTGRVHIEHVETRRKGELTSIVREKVRRGSEVMTDELLSYDGLNSDYAHKVINHAEQYVNGHVHTNRMENFWSLLKRGIGGTYVAVEPFHLFRYLDEQAFRYNNREITDAERFTLVMSKIVGKRLTYNQLTGKTESGAEMRP
jgi:transposase-like protein